MLEKLVESGLIQPHGQGRGRTYTLSPEIYQAQGEEVAYTRQAGFSRIQHEQMVLGHVSHHLSIQRKEVMELCHLNPDQAYRLLKRLVDEKKLAREGVGSATYYTLP